MSSVMEIAMKEMSDLIAAAASSQSAIDVLKADNALHYQSGLSVFSRKAFLGQSVLIELWGDSLYLGAGPDVLQEILRSYYSNNNITVLNKATGGEALYERLVTWDADMASSTADIVYTDYCVNDAIENLNVDGYAETYRNNLIEFIKIARRYNKIIILETPNTVWSAKALNFAMTVTQVDNIKSFVEVMHKVAIEYNVPLVDNFYLTQKYMESGYETGALFDALHTDDALHRYKALQRASSFIYPHIPRAYKNSIIPIYSPGIINTGGADGALAKSKVGRFVVALSIRIPIWVEENNSDVYVALSKWSNGCTAGTIKFDGVVVRSDLNLVQSIGFVTDMEVLVKSKAKQGFHLIEIVSNHATKQVGGTYVTVRSNKRKSYNQIPSGASLESYDVVLDRVRITNDADAKYLITDIPTSNFVSARTIQFKAQLNKTNGVLLNWSPVDINNIGFGVALTLDFATGFLTIYEFNGSVINSTTLGSTDLSTASHEYKIIMGTNGSISVYVDNVLVGTVTLTTFYGGYLGFLVYGNATQLIDYVKVY